MWSKKDSNRAPKQKRAVTPQIKIWEPPADDESYAEVAGRIRTLIEHQDALIDICSRHHLATAQFMPASHEIEGKIDIVLMLTEKISAGTAANIQREIEGQTGVTVNVTDSPHASLSLGMAEERMTARLLSRGLVNAR